MVDVVVVGVVGRDLVLAIEELPPGGGSGPVTHRQEILGGAANQAVGSRQLGLSAALVGVVGSDAAGSAMLDQVRADGIDPAGVVVREGASTALMVDLVEADGTSRVLEHVPGPMLLTVEDVRRSAALLRSARAVLVQLEQPADAVLEAVRTAAEAGAMVVGDGVVSDHRDEVLASLDVLRADDSEAARLMGRHLSGATDVVDAARELLDAGPSVVALAAGDEGNVVVWDGGHVLVPLLGGDAVDPTGAGDAFLVGAAAALLDGQDAATAAWWASAAAALTVAGLGGRPHLDRARLSALASSARRDAERGDGP